MWDLRAVCVCLLIGQLNYARCNADYVARPAPTRPKVELTIGEMQERCALSHVWPELLMFEVECPDRLALKAQRYCMDPATVGVFRKKDNLLVNCLAAERKK